MTCKCPKCKKIMSRYEVDSLYCVNCNQYFSSKDELISDEISMPTPIIEDTPAGYRLDPDAPLFEYKVESVYDNTSGRVSTVKLNKLINSYAKKGWHLTNVITNEIGKDSVTVKGGFIASGVNATIDEIILFFERRLIRINTSIPDESKISVDTTKQKPHEIEVVLLDILKEAEKPVSINDISDLINGNYMPMELLTYLQRLVDQGKIKKHKGYYSLSDIDE